MPDLNREENGFPENMPKVKVHYFFLLFQMTYSFLGPLALINIFNNAPFVSKFCSSYSSIRD